MFAVVVVVVLVDADVTVVGTVALLLALSLFVVEEVMSDEEVRFTVALKM